MISRAMFYLNQNKPTIYEAASACAAQCAQHGIKPVFLRATGLPFCSTCQNGRNVPLS